jgi:hypothetical protein
VKQKVLSLFQGLVLMAALFTAVVLLPTATYAQQTSPPQPIGGVTGGAGGSTGITGGAGGSTSAGGGTVTDTDDRSGESGLVPCGNSVDKPCTIAHLFRGFVVMTNYLVSLAGIIAVISITYAGFRMVTSQGSETERGAAKKRLTNALIGMVLVFIAFVLVNSLFAGSLNLGIRDGAKALTDPAGYIRGAGSTGP